jgi:hypothetical protein
MGLLPSYKDNVFMNCPFDSPYQSLFRATVFTIHDCGFIARCALEAKNSAQNRLDKIMDIIEQCKYGIHDISRTELNENELPRFNMPLELGLFLGCRKYGEEHHRDKSCLILDKEPHRYHHFISDIAGQDIDSHDQNTSHLIKKIRNYLTTESSLRTIPGGEQIAQHYERFEGEFPSICQNLGIDFEPEDFIFADFSSIVVQWLKLNPLVKNTFRSFKRQK